MGDANKQTSKTAGAAKDTDADVVTKEVEEEEPKNKYNKISDKYNTGR